MHSQFYYLPGVSKDSINLPQRSSEMGWQEHVQQDEQAKVASVPSQSAAQGLPKKFRHA